ncbi:MAG: phosphotransferase family protein [Candidatus Binatia bacterium]
MAIPAPRDPDVTRERLGPWVSSKLSGAREVAISRLEIPRSGFSNETFYFDVDCTEGDTRRRERLVVRARPEGDGLFLGGDVMLQWRVMRAVERTAVPVPPLFWAEPDPTILGSPFFVMGRVDGRVATEVPSYHRRGWVVDLTPADRERLWRNGMAELVKVAKLDWRSGFDFLAAGAGEPGLERYVGWVAEWYRWAAKGRDMGVADAALEWVLANRPRDPSLAVVWGDSRIGNMIVRDDLSIAAVIDWEMATLGPAEVDLGWWLFFERFLTEGSRTPGLEGIPGREETIARWESLVGRRARDVPYYEVLGALRMAIIVMRGTAWQIEAGMLPPATAMASRNPVSQILARSLDLPIPELAPEYEALLAKIEAG